VPGTAAETGLVTVRVTELCGLVTVRVTTTTVEPNIPLDGPGVGVEVADVGDPLTV